MSLISLFKSLSHDCGWLALLAWVAASYGAGVIASLFTLREDDSWYLQLKHPPYTPPTWVFSAIWGVLHLLQGVAAWIVWQMPDSPARATGLKLFGLGLVLYVFWSWIFFTEHALGWALVELVLVWTIGVYTLAAFRHVHAFALLLLWPYMAWISFFVLLNFDHWRLNRTQT